LWYICDSKKYKNNDDYSHALQLIMEIMKYLRKNNNNKLAKELTKPNQELG